MANNWTLIDITGHRTRWGFWDPEELNFVRMNFDQRGINALQVCRALLMLHATSGTVLVQIMSWLISAYHMTNDVKYLNGFTQLGISGEYFLNIVNQKITTPSD